MDDGSPSPEDNTMDTKKVQIIDLGRGPQIEGHRLTVMDIFYYLHRGYDFDFIHQAIPSLTHEQFDAVVAYVNEHHEELVEKDRQIDEFHQRGMEAQRARGGVFAASEEDLTTPERIARLKDKMKRRLSAAHQSQHGIGGLA